MECTESFLVLSVDILNLIYLGLNQQFRGYPNLQLEKDLLLFPGNNLEITRRTKSVTFFSHAKWRAVFPISSMGP
jgi:hypothetical protein